MYDVNGPLFLGPPTEGPTTQAPVTQAPATTAPASPTGKTMNCFFVLKNDASEKLKKKTNILP